MEKNPLRIALFAGSFDPFTIGHADIVRRALALFDRLNSVLTPFAGSMPVKLVSA